MVVRGSEVAVGRVIPHLVVHDAAGAADFYNRAFGAKEVYRSRQPDGRGLHVHLRIADSLIIVSDMTNYERSSIDDKTELRHRSHWAVLPRFFNFSGRMQMSRIAARSMRARNPLCLYLTRSGETDTDVLQIHTVTFGRLQLSVKSCLLMRSNGECCGPIRNTPPSTVNRNRK